MPTTNLIIQAPDIPSSALKHLHMLSKATNIEALQHTSHQAFRLTQADESSKAAVAQFCAAEKLDFGFVAADVALSDYKLLAMDMDSTLITIECIDEIADFINKKAEVAAITEAAMRGEIDWPQSLRQRVALLEGLPASTLETVYQQRLKLTPGAAQLVAAAQAAGIKTLLVSGGFTFFTERLQARLKLDYAFSNTLEITANILTGKVVGPLCDATAKATHVQAIATQLGASKAQIITIGDGANDLAMMAVSGTSIAYHAKPKVQAQARYALNVTDLQGGLALLGG
jgi:phosphoserine phosphatase